MREDEIETVLPGFGKDGRKALGGKVLKLVHVEREILSLLLGNGVSCLCRLSEARHKERA